MIRRLFLSYRIWGPGMLLFLGVWGFYAHTLGYDFVWDDFGSIVHNQALRDWNESFASFYSRSSVPGSQYDPSLLETQNYRPLRTVVHAVVFHAAGLRPFWYHLLNVTGHATVALLLFYGFWYLTKNQVGAFLGALFFAVHPALTEPVCWAKSLEDMLAALCCFGAFLLFELGLRVTSLRRFASFIGCVLLYTLALTAKMSVVFLPAFLLLRWLIEYRRELPAAVKEARQGLVVILLLGGVTASGLVVQHLVLGHTAQSDFLTGSCWTTWLSMPRIFVRYLFMEFLPFGMLADYESYPRAATLADWGFWLYVWVWLVLLIWGSLVLYRKQLWQGWLWFWCALLPFSNLVPMVQLGADRFLYLATIGMAWLVAEFSARYLINRRLLFPAILFLTVFAGCAWMRSTVWRNERTLWTETVRQSPASLRPRENLVKALIADREFQSALDHAGYLVSHSDKPAYQVLRGYALCLNGNYQEGLPILIRYRADSVLNIVGVQAIRNGRPDLAERCFSAAAQINPRDSRYQRNLELLRRDHPVVDPGQKTAAGKKS